MFSTVKIRLRWLSQAGHNAPPVWRLELGFGVVGELVAEGGVAADRFGSLTHFVANNIPTFSTRAQQLGGHPTQPSLLADLKQGRYFSKWVAVAEPYARSL